MLKITENNAITLTRGDTARLSVNITNNKGEAYQVREKDTCILSVKKKLSDAEPCISKTVIGKSDFYIKPEDTEHLPFGMYIYSVRVVTVEGDKYTVIDNKSFKIGEVT